jgi:hypothetical protein
MVKNIETIATKEIKETNEKNENVILETLNEEALKVFIGKYLIELACLSIFTGLSLRLNNIMDNTITETEKLTSADIQSFFSVIINGLIIPIEVLENAVDKNNEEENAIELDRVIDDEKKKYLGIEATKIFYDGLKGNNKDNVKQQELFQDKKVTRLYMARREALKESAIFTINALSIVNKFLDDISPEKE